MLCLAERLLLVRTYPECGGAGPRLKSGCQSLDQSLFMDQAESEAGDLNLQREHHTVTLSFELIK